VNDCFKKRRARIGALTFGLAGLFVLAAIRLAMVVLVDGPRLSSLARSEHTTAMELTAVRGPIVDRNGKPLALSAETRSVYARPRRLRENSTVAERAKLAAALRMAPAELEAELHRPAPFVWLKRHVAPENARAVEDLGLEGVGDLSEYKRFYPESNLAASVVGLAGMDGQGLSGVELQYDKLIRGEPVELRFYHDALGNPIFDSPLALKNAEPGARLELTIDSSIQSMAESYLAAQIEKSGAKRGSAVVLDPFTGEVLALANDYADRRADDGRLHNAAVQDAFEPGSTMKGILGAVALQDHVFDTTREIYCENGQWRVGGRAIHDDSPHQRLNLGGIIEVSSNIGAAKIALALGAQRFYQGLAAFGLGRKSGVDLPGEAAGLIRAPSTWRQIELADHGFGQGVAVTPIQLATAYAAIANGGIVMRPFVVRAAYDADGREILRHTPQALRRAVSPDVAHTMNQLLRGAVDGPEGTGRLARVADFTVAGKTGTAQMVNPVTGTYYQSRLVASFVGFVPAEDPRMVILVVLYDVPHGHFGGLFAAPVFSEIAGDALAHLEVVPPAPSYETASLLPFGVSDNSDQHDEGAPESRSDSSVNTGFASVSAASGIVPEFRGLSLRAALDLARSRRIDVEISGSGYVVRQKPGPGAVLARPPAELTLMEKSEARPLPALTGSSSHQHRDHLNRVRVNRVRAAR